MDAYNIYDARGTKSWFATNKKIGHPQLIITSPPYFNLKNYGGEPNQIGYGQKYEDYLSDVTSVLQQCFDISTDDATLWVIIDTFRINNETIPLPFHIIEKLKSTHDKKTWILRDIVIWHKTKNTPWHAEGRFRNHFEYILFFVKSNKFVFNIDQMRETGDYKKWWIKYPERYNSNGRTITNIWEHSSPIRGWGNSRQNHMCALPFPLIENILNLCSVEGDVVFDPFAGSGSVLGLADVMGREGVGFDLNNDYKNQFTSEVCTAAKQYWNKRAEGKKRQTKSNLDFRQLNLALRKLKSAFLLRQLFPAAHKLKILVTSPSSKSNKIRIVVRLNHIEKEKFSKPIASKIMGIEKTMKTKIEIKFYGEKSFKEQFKKRKKWNLYANDKFYKLIGPIRSSSIENNSVILSNIKVPKNLDAMMKME